jgi:hypothetical protein
MPNELKSTHGPFHPCCPFSDQACGRFRSAFAGRSAAFSSLRMRST